MDGDGGESGFSGGDIFDPVEKPKPQPMDILGGNLPTAPQDLSGEGIMALLRQLALATVPTQEAQITEGINRAAARASGSIPAITETLLPQIANLRRSLNAAFESVSRRLGPRGGGQVKAGEGAVLNDFGQALQSLLMQGTLQGQAGQFGFLSSIRPALQAQIPPLTSQSTPFDTDVTGAALGKIIPFAQRLLGGSPGNSFFTPNPHAAALASSLANATAGPAVFGPFE